MTTAAQEEFEGFYKHNQSSKLKGHPDDRDSSDTDSTTLNEDEKPWTPSISPSIPTTTYLPNSTQFDANTGPKGVIADARSFETAKKRSFRQTLYDFSSKATGGASPSKKWREKSKSPSPDMSTDEEEDEFMRTWRASRLDELASMSRDIRTRRQSPSQRTYGSLVTVDPSGYLDAVEKVPSYTTVVVLIYDDEVGLLQRRHSSPSLMTAANTYPLVRTQWPG